MKINIKKQAEFIQLPFYSREGDAYMDIQATTFNVYEKYIEYGTGLFFEIPEGFFLDIRPRSSISNYDLILINSPGTLDSNYRGELKIRFKMLGKDFYDVDKNIYNTGDKIAQIAVLPILKIEWNEVNELSKTNRNANGFGSSGL